MALTKTVFFDRISIESEYKVISIRECTIIKDGEVELSKTYTRNNLAPSSCAKDKESEDPYEWTGTFTHTPTDISGESAEIQAICNLVWTDAVKAAFKTHLEADCI